MKGWLSKILMIVLASSSFAIKEECIKGASYLYSGIRSTTESGHTCQRWDISEPHDVKQTPQDGGDHNYCRNPDRDSRGTWCYTTDPNTRWEYCSIPKCDESIYTVWTSYNTIKNSASFLYVQADPELMSQKGFVDYDKLYDKEFPNSQFKALAVGKNGKKIFFVDVINNYLGVSNRKTLKVDRYLEGKASNIYAISQDFVTQNIYYTNTKTKSVMVADKKFRSQLAIYNCSPSEPRALAILHNQRKIVFSTYVKLNTTIRGAQIVMADMSGRNAEVLHKSPEVVDVTGLAIDDTRIYWTDNLGYASRVMSCRFDGSNKTQHYFKKFGSYEDIAVYSSYIYVTDSNQRFNYFDHIRYNVDVIAKDSSQVFTYTKPEQPHGIAIFRKMDDSELTNDVDSFLKICQKKCGGVCLPDFRGIHRCHCSFGYRLRKMSGACVQIRAKLEEGEIKKTNQ